MKKAIRDLTRTLPPGLREVFKINCIYLQLAELGLGNKDLATLKESFTKIYSQVREEYSKLCLNKAADDMTNNQPYQAIPIFDLIYDISKQESSLQISIKDSNYCFLMIVKIPDSVSDTIQSRIKTLLVELVCSAVNLYTIDLNNFGTEHMGVSTKDALCGFMRLTDEQLTRTIKKVIKDDPEGTNKYIYRTNKINYIVRTKGSPIEN